MKRLFNWQRKLCIEQWQQIIKCWALSANQYLSNWSWDSFSFANARQIAQSWKLECLSFSERKTYFLVNCVLNCLHFGKIGKGFLLAFAPLMHSNFIKVNSKKNDCVARNGCCCKKANAEVKIINRFEQYFISKWMEIMCGAKHYVQMDELTLCLIFFLARAPFRTFPSCHCHYENLKIHS